MFDKEVYQFLQAQSDEIVHHIDLLREKLPDDDADLRHRWNALYTSWALFDNHLFNSRADWQKEN